MIQQTKQRINEPTFISSFLPNKVYFKNSLLLIEEGIMQQIPRRSSLLAASLPMAIRLERPKPGARSIRRSHCASGIIMQPCEATSRKLIIASLREEKCKNRFKRDKTPHRGVFLILNRKPLPCYLKRIVGQFEKSFLKDVDDFWYQILGSNF
jgi:hypothetical protein